MNNKNNETIKVKNNIKRLTPKPIYKINRIKKKMYEPPLKLNKNKSNKTEFISNKSKSSTIIASLSNKKNGLFLKNETKKNDIDIKNKITLKKEKKSHNIKNMIINIFSSSLNSSSKNLIQNKWNKEFKSLKSYEFIKNNKLTEQELNTLEYELAILKDKRTFFQYYFSLLKKKQ